MKMPAYVPFRHLLIAISVALIWAIASPAQDYVRDSRAAEWTGHPRLHNRDNRCTQCLAGSKQTTDATKRCWKALPTSSWNLKEWEGSIVLFALSSRWLLSILQD
jgi:hypothetical protein